MREQLYVNKELLCFIFYWRLGVLILSVLISFRTVSFDLFILLLAGKSFYLLVFVRRRGE